MKKIVNEIMNEQLHRYEIDIYLVSFVTVKINCNRCCFAFDPEIHKVEDKDSLDNPILKIKQEDIIAWK